MGVRLFFVTLQASSCIYAKVHRPCLSYTYCLAKLVTSKELIEITLDVGLLNALMFARLHQARDSCGNIRNSPRSKWETHSVFFFFFLIAAQRSLPDGSTRATRTSRHHPKGGQNSGTDTTTGEGWHPRASRHVSELTDSHFTGRLAWGSCAGRSLVELSTRGVDDLMFLTGHATPFLLALTLLESAIPSTRLPDPIQICEFTNVLRMYVHEYLLAEPGKCEFSASN